MSDINNADCFNCGCSCDNVACYTRNDAQLEKMQEEIERLKAESTTFYKGFQGMQEAFSALTAKHERLVKGLKQNFSWVKGLSEFLTEEGNV